jgi:hypothetical protein
MDLELVKELRYRIPHFSFNFAFIPSGSCSILCIPIIPHDQHMLQGKWDASEHASEHPMAFVLHGAGGTYDHLLGHH